MYSRTYPLPMQRDDINTAMIRQSCGRWGKEVPGLDKLLPQYGTAKKKRRKRSSEELKEIGKLWANDSARPRRKDSK